MIRVFLLVSLAFTLAILHALPFLPRPHRLFGVPVPDEVRYGAAGQRLLKRFQIGLMPWTCAAILAAVWLPMPQFGIWMPVATLAAAAAAVWNFVRCRSEALRFASPVPSTREAALVPDESHLGALPLFLAPLAIPAATAVYLHLHWDAIPARFPIHWGIDGTPNGWATRSVAGVYGPLILGAVLVCFMAAIRWLTIWGSRRNAHNRAAQAVMLGVAFVIAAGFSMAALLPLKAIPLWGVLAFHAVALPVLALIAWREVRRDAESGGETTPEQCWHWGGIYYNPDDPALFVEKRIGIGWTLNFANRLSWIALSLMLLVPVAVVFLARSFTSR